MSEPESVARLRRAAAVLRERAAALPEGLHARWTSSGEVVESGVLFVAECEGIGGAEVATHIAATASPDTVLVLAAWLDAEAKREAHSLAEFGYRVVPNEAHELARLVLREDEGSEA